MIRLAVLACLAAVPAAAQEGSKCAPNREAAVAYLGGNISEGGYEESQIAVMLDPQLGMMVELFGNPNTGSWTILTVAPDGTTCIETSGVGFQSFPYRPAGAPA